MGVEKKSFAGAMVLLLRKESDLAGMIALFVRILRTGKKNPVDIGMGLYDFLPFKLTFKTRSARKPKKTGQLVELSQCGIEYLHNKYL